MLATKDKRPITVLYEPDQRHILYAGDFDPLARDGAIIHESGKIETLTQGFELTIPLYKDPTGESKQYFRVGDKIMTESVELMVEYGGLEAVAKEKVRTFYTNDYLPKASGS